MTDQARLHQIKKELDAQLTLVSEIREQLEDAEQVAFALLRKHTALKEKIKEGKSPYPNPPPQAREGT